MGTVDILINNAGGPPKGSFQNHDSTAWDLAIQTNLMSVIRFSKAVTPFMKKIIGEESYPLHLLLEKNLLP